MSTEAASAPAPEHVSAPGTAQPPTTVNDCDQQPAADQIECAKPAFLHSPPDSNNHAKSEGSDSELSDLDEDAFDQPENAQADTSEAQPEPPVDDIGEVVPDHWSGTVPVFCPTMHQFKDFKLFMEKVDSYGMKSGIIKIIPPQEWKDNLPKLDELVKQIRVREPISQEIMGSGGTYRQVNVLHGRSYNLPQWRKLCEQSEHQPPARRGERRAAVEKPKSAPRPRAPAVPKAGSSNKKRGATRGRARGRKKAMQEDDAAETEDRPMTPVSPKPEEETLVKKEEVAPSVEEELGMDLDDDATTPTVGRMGRMGGIKPAKAKAQTVSARRKNARREGSAAIDEEAFKEFDYKMDISDYTAERCEELERIYWKTLTYAPPLYGADMLGTLFAESTESWNLNRLPNLLDVLGTKVPGVNTAYLYLGMWKATFAWHLEDVDLYSINYLHFGAPKQWYSISQGDARRFEAAMRQTWPADAKSCDQFLRHKGYLISPQHLKQHFNITVNKCLSYPGEFVVTYPYGYHSGYNLGYNCAEAVNFALDSWLPMGKIAKRCECAQAQDSVWVDVYEIERRLRGDETEYEETEEEEDEDEDDLEDASGLPSPPDSHGIRFKAPSRKRKRDPKDKDTKTKTKKIRLRIKTRVEPPCCLCPNDIPSAELLPTDDGRKAHRMCALYLPETYIDIVDSNEVVANIAAISKERLDLKCLYCRSKRGGCFQCSHKKCARAYHATCAAAAGVFVEEADVPVFDEDGTEYKEQAFEFSCRFHRTKRDRKFDGSALEEDTRIQDAAKAVKKGDLCQMQFFKGDIFAGVVVENRVDERMLLLDIVPTGDRVEVEWKWLLVPDAADYRLPKASAKAIPLPPTRKAKEKLNAKRTDQQLPRKDDPFVDGGFQWAEFNTCELDINKEQAKLDLTKDNTVWYFLGKGSTDAKPQYTESPALPRHNPKSNFLETLPKPKKAPKLVTKSVPAPVVQQAFVNQFSTGMPSSATQITPPVRPPTAAATSLPTTARSEKPYVYKPRKPVEPTWSLTTQNFTPQQVPARQSPMPSPLGRQYTFANNFQGQAGYFPQAGHTTQAGHVAQAAQQKPVRQTLPQNAAHSQTAQQRFVPTYTQGGYSPYGPHSPAPVATPGTAQSSKSWPAAAPGQHYQPYQPPRQFQNPVANKHLAPREEPQMPTYAPSPYAAQAAPAHQATIHPPRPAPAKQTPARSYSVDQQPTIYQKYPFFMVNHNRNRDHYRSPYNPSGGFMNGYEGNFKAHMMNLPFSVVEKYARPKSNNGPPASLGTPASTATAGQPSLAPAPPAGTTQTAARPQQGTPAPGQTQFVHYTQSSNPFSSAVPQGRAPSLPMTAHTPSQSPSTTQHHPAIRPQYPNSVTTTSVPPTMTHPTSTSTPQRPGPSVQTPTSQPVLAAMPTVSTTTSVTSTPVSAPAKPAAPKVQYKIPERETPIPLPPTYLAAKKKAPAPASATPTLTTNVSRAPETPAPSTELPVSSAKSTPHSTPVPASSPNRTGQQQGQRISETPVPIPLPRVMASQKAQPTVRPVVAPSTTPSTAASPTGASSPPVAGFPTPSQASSASLASSPQPLHPTAKQAPKSFRPPVTETPVPLPPIPGRPVRILTSESPAPLAAAPALEKVSAEAENDKGGIKLSKEALDEAERELDGIGFPDVPRDSMALVEQMMVNLRRASSHSAPET